jgi:GntR family transcriptional regulator/MocR family aminotransferase
VTAGLLDMRPAPAGMRLLGVLPQGVDARAVSWTAAERGVQVTPLSRSAPQSITEGREGLLLGYSAFGRDATEAALEVLAGVIREHAAKARPERAVVMRQGA